MNMIEELYRGHVKGVDDVVYADTPLGDALNAYTENVEKLCEFLKGTPEMKWLAKLMDAHDEMIQIEGEQKFVKGWIFGAQIMADTFEFAECELIRD